MDEKKFAVQESRLKLLSDWRRVQFSVTSAQMWRQSVTSVTLFDVRPSVAYCQTMTAHSSYVREENKH